MGAITPVISQGIGVASALTGGNLPFLGPAGQILNAVNLIANDPEKERRKQLRAEQDLALQQLQQKQALQQSQLAAQTALDRDKLALEAQQNEDARRQALRRAVARQKAQFGGAGVSTNGGSSQAVLLGLFDESEDDLNQRAQLDNLRNAALDQNLSNSRSLNLLQATQLAQRQNLERLF